MALAPTQSGSTYREWTIWVVAPPTFGPRGLTIEWEGDRKEIEWAEIERAFAAEVGEPEGVRAVVFDLLSKSPTTGSALLRFSVDPSEGPKRPAQTIAEYLGAKHCSPSLQTLAREGKATEIYSHLDLLDEALIEKLAASS